MIKRYISAFAAIAAVFQTGTAQAQVETPEAGPRDCSSYEGKSAALQNINTVMAHFSGLKPKGEFETTSQYQERLNLVSAKLGGPVIIPMNVNPYFLEYDADAQLLRVEKAAFDYADLNIYFTVGFSNIGETRIPVSLKANRAVEVSENYVPLGSYVASNAFGAKFQVTKARRTFRGILEPSEETTPLFAAEGKYVGAISMSVAEAQRIKPRIKLAVAVVPTAPFVVARNYRMPPKATDPSDEARDFKVLIGDIQCALVLDGSNKVLAAYKTQ